MGDNTGEDKDKHECIDYLSDGEVLYMQKALNQNDVNWNLHAAKVYKQMVLPTKEGEILNDPKKIEIYKDEISR